MTEYFILAGLWILYCVLHSVLASLSFKAAAKQWMGRSYKHYRLLYTLFAFAGLVGILWYQLGIQADYLFEQTVVTYVAGVIISLIGLVIMANCIGKYFISLSGIKSLVQETPSNQLIISGVHRFVRHPLYLGTFFFIWGLWILFPMIALLIANTIITTYTLIAIKLEEDKLIVEFGDSYKDYQASVPKIWPSFKASRGLWP